MKILVVGSGLIGVTTAYFLRTLGHDVTVIDRQPGPGQQTSFANGGLLTPSMSGPWNSPGCWRVLLRSLIRSDAPLQISLRLLPALTGWGIDFLRNSRPTAYERNTLSNLRLALHSLKMMSVVRQQTSIEYGLSAVGTLKFFRTAASLESAAAAAGRLASEGLIFQQLSAAATVRLEPALKPIGSRMVGSLFYPEDESGNAYRFCVGLAEKGRELGVKYIFGTNVICLEKADGIVTAIVSEQGRHIADRYVIAAGSHSTTLLHTLGMNLPVRPAKGYSITFDQTSNKSSLRIPVVDDHLHMVAVPLEGGFRVAGTAEFSGFDLSLPEGRIQNLMTLLREVLPEDYFDFSKATPWCGLRPMSVDGTPIIGATPMVNLFLNTGHGHLGWTMAAGSGHLLAELISGRVPSIDLAPYAFSRFLAR